MEKSTPEFTEGIMPSKKILDREASHHSLMQGFRDELIAISEVNKDLREVDFRDLTEEDAIMWGRIRSFKGGLPELAQLRDTLARYEADIKTLSNGNIKTARSNFAFFIATHVMHIQIRVEGKAPRQSADEKGK